MCHTINENITRYVNAVYRGTGNITLTVGNSILENGEEVFKDILKMHLITWVQL